MIKLVLPLLLAQWSTQGIRVNDEGAVKGYATQVNCTGSGVSCSSNGVIWTLDFTGGGGGGAPTTVPYLVMAADPTLSAEVVVPACTGTQKLTSNGTAISCASDVDTTNAPGGSNTQVQFNDGGSFGGDAGLTYNKTTDVLTTSSLVLTAPVLTSAVTIPNDADLKIGTPTIRWQSLNSALQVDTPLLVIPNGVIRNDSTSGVGLAFTSNGVVLDLGTGTNDYFRSNGARIETPGDFQVGGLTCTACITASTEISATGTPNASTFLRGDNVWAAPAGGSAHVITDEGGAGLTARPTLNFTGAAVTATDNAGSNRTDVTIPWPTLDQVGNPTGDKAFTFPSGNKLLWTFSGGTDYAFSIHGDGAFGSSGDLVHLHMQGTSVTALADVLHVESEDADAVGIRVNNNSGTPSTTQSITVDGKINAGGVITATGGFSGILDTDLPTVPVSKGGLGKTTLTSAGAIPIGTSGTTTYADLAGGAIGTILYNSAANTPAWLTNGTTTGQVLLATAGAAPSWGYPGYRRTGSNYTNGTTTVTDITGLSWAVASGVPVAFRCTLAVLNSNAASTIRYAVNGPSMTTVVFKTKMHKASVTTEVNENFTAVSANAQTAGVSSGVSTTAHIDTIEGVAIPSANGTMQIRAAGTTAQTSTVYQGSSCFVF